jgi:DNA-binding transcriptional ArsR family regulator
MAHTHTEILFDIPAFQISDDKTQDVLTFTRADRDVLYVLAYRARSAEQEKTNKAWPGYGEIAKRAFVSRRQVMYSIAKLARMQIITIDKRDDGGSNEYTLNVDRMTELATLKQPKSEKGRKSGTVTYKGKTYPKREKSPALPPPDDTLDEFDKEKQ